MIKLFLSMAFITMTLYPGTWIYAQNKADNQAIHKLIDAYGETENAGDMMAQAKLMSADRVWIGPGGAGRITDQKQNMEMQQAQLDAEKAFVPNVKWFSDARDRLVKYYGNGKVAVASFYWYRNFVLPADIPMEKAKLFSQPPPLVVSLVLEKNGENWKIVHTHTSFLNLPDSGN